ncbi:MAG: hypothetical protein H7256_05435 [Bdellovibrio sp.]|nr:hypothetical protein [Bdellovibrio sp.]
MELTTAVAIATIVNGLALAYDVFRRYNKRSVGEVKVPNGNPDGFHQFMTIDYTKHTESLKPNAKRILIRNDNSVEIQYFDNSVICFATFIRWIESAESTEKKI